MKVFSYEQGERLAEVFNRHGVEYLFIGKSGAIFYGFPETTQDAVIFAEKSAENGKKLVSALRELGYELTSETEQELIAGQFPVASLDALLPAKALRIDRRIVRACPGSLLSATICAAKI